MNWRTGLHHYRKKTMSHSFAGICQFSWLSLWLSSKQVLRGLLAGIVRKCRQMNLWIQTAVRRVDHDSYLMTCLCVSCRGNNISQVHERFTFCWIKTKWTRSLHSRCCTTVLLDLHCSEESLYVFVCCAVWKYQASFRAWCSLTALKLCSCCSLQTLAYHLMWVNLLCI